MLPAGSYIGHQLALIFLVNQLQTFHLAVVIVWTAVYAHEMIPSICYIHHTTSLLMLMNHSTMNKVIQTVSSNHITNNSLKLLESICHSAFGRLFIVALHCGILTACPQITFLLNWMFIVLGKPFSWQTLFHGKPFFIS